MATRTTKADSLSEAVKLAKELFDVGTSTCGNADGTIFDDIPPNIKMGFVAMADHILRNFKRREPAALRTYLARERR